MLTTLPCEDAPGAVHEGKALATRVQGTSVEWAVRLVGEEGTGSEEGTEGWETGEVP